MKTFYQKIDAFNAKNMYEINKDDLFRTVEAHWRARISIASRISEENTKLSADGAARTLCMTVIEASPDLDKTIEIQERHEDVPTKVHDISIDSM